MHYVLLIHQDPAAPLDPAEMAQIGPAVGRFDAELSARGQNLGSLRLCDAAQAQVIRVRGGEVLATDGPFLETKEQLGGVWLIEAADDAEAARIAADLPTATFCSVEVRPLQGVDLRGAVQAYYDPSEQA